MYTHLYTPKEVKVNTCPTMYVRVNIRAQMWDEDCVRVHMVVRSLHGSHQSERGPLPFREIRRLVFQRHIPQCRAILLLGPIPVLISAQQILAFIH